MRQIFLSSRAYFIFVGVAVAAPLVGGCGSSDSSAITVQTGSLTKAQFIKRADAICREGRRQIKREFSAYLRRNIGSVSPQSPQSEQGAAAAEIVSTIYVPGNEKEIDRISSLGAPSGDEEEVEAILAAIQEGLDEARDHPLMFLQAQNPKYRRPFVEASKLAKSYGLAHCGRLI